MPESTPTTRWSLDDLYAAPDDPRLNADLARIKEAAERFSETYRGRIAALTPAELQQALAAFEQLYSEGGKPLSYASLRFAADTRPENGALMQHVREATTAAAMPTIFFNVELTAIGAARLIELAESPELANYRHHLIQVAAEAAHQLSEPEEKIQAELSITGRQAFTRLFEEITSSLRFTVPGRDTPLNLSQALDLQRDSDRETRRAAAEAITAGLEPQGRIIAFIFNTLLQDKATRDRLRGYAYPEESRHIANELTPETVETVVGVVGDGYGLVARFYETKRRLLGLPRLAHYDRYAQLEQGDENPEITFAAARETVLRAFSKFDESAYAPAAAEFFDRQWIDADPAPNKRGGAFCSYITPDLHPYILMNYLGSASDVRTLAHELGHGIHSSLSRCQTYLNFHGTLPMAEVASTFAEMLVFEEQTRQASETARLIAYANQIEQGIATIFRQTAIYRFEQAVHAERREQGELSVERFGELWQEKIGAMFEGSVTLEPGHANWWMYIAHFISTPFYVYAYSFGEMLALALFHQFRSGAPGFVEKYLDMLRAGGSKSPADLINPLGIELSDPAFWKGALAVFESEVTAFEALARKVMPDRF